MRRFALLALSIGLLVAGCTLNPATNKRQLVLTTESQEKELGRRATREIEQSIGVVSDPRIAAYVTKVGQKVATGAPAGQFDYEFRVVEMEEPNAFAVPGGYVFVSRGLLALTNTEAELAGILGHEVGHVAARHGTNQASVQAPLRIATGLGAAATGIVSSSLGDFVSGIGGAATDAVFASYGRDQEREADQLGQRFMATTGYDPAGLSSALDSLHRYALQHGQDDGPSFISSHPSTPERVDATRAAARELGAAAPPSSSSRSTHLAALDGLRMGEDPDHGVFVGTDFIQPAMGFTIRFPDGWEAANARDFVAAKSAEAFVLVTLVDAPGPMEAGRAIEQRDGVDLELEPTRIGGLPAARGRAKAKLGRNDAVLDVVWIEHGGLLYQMVGISPVSGAERDRASIDATMKSFRPATLADRKRIRVDRLRLVHARAGETIESVAKRTGSQGAAEELAVLNGVALNEPLRRGEAVKVIRREGY